MPPEFLEYAVAAVSCFVMGALVSWAVCRLRQAAKHAEIQGDYRARIAVLNKTIQHQSDESEALRKELASHRQEEERLRAAVADLQNRRVQLETIVEKERSSLEEKLSLLEDARTHMTDAYQALSDAALRENNQAFMQLAQSTLARYLESVRVDWERRQEAIQSVVQPVQQALERFDQHVRTVEKEREKAYGGLSEQVRELGRSQSALERETGKLVKALRVPHVRGRWGEITLRRVAELAGMENRCDFFEQPSLHHGDGIQRPDMIVHLPGDRHVVVDAKVPIAAYLDALEAESEQDRHRHLRRHAQQVIHHIHQLSQKAYWKQFPAAPEFVVLFIPGENFFSAAVAHSPEIIEVGAARNVVLATPTTLISLLKTVALGWSRETTAENARAIAALGNELYERLYGMVGHLESLRRDIEKCAGSYNRLLGSMEKRVLVSARKLRELGISATEEKSLQRPESVETPLRKPNTEWISES